MNPSKLKILFMMFLFGLLESSCMKEDIGIDLTANNWKVERFKQSGQLTFTNTDSTYILQFFSDEVYNLSLDVNTCMGNYDILRRY